jgi:hypothetical protein
MLCLLLFVGTQAMARPFYLGSWKIISSQPAPWVAPDAKPAPVDPLALSGRTITFGRQSISGPPLLGCQGPRYVVKRYPPEALFQGNLTAPARQARMLGYRSATIRTLETGCEHLIEYHFIGANEALFALDNRLWRIRRIRR